MSATTTTTTSLSTVLTADDLFPNGGCDTHHHIFEPSEFAYHPDRHLTPPAATIQSFLAFKQKLGITRSILTHGLSYGADCTSLKNFVPRLGNQTKGIGVFDPEATSDEELLSLQEAGVRGSRVNLYAYKAMDDPALQIKVLKAHVDRLQKLNLRWCLTMTLLQPSLWNDLQPFVETQFASNDVQLVTDHFALLKAPSMLAPEYKHDLTLQPGFQTIMALVRSGHLWVKLSAPYRVSEMSPHYPDLRPLVRAFVDANKQQVLWGSDWPHTPRMKVRTKEEALQEAPYLVVDDEAWLRSLRSWLSDEEWDFLMVKNPSRLFDS